MWSTRLAVIVALVCCVSAEDMFSGMKVVYNSYKQCETAPDTMVCLKARALKLLDRAIKAENIPIVDGISLSRRPESERSLNSVSLEELPADLEGRANKVDDLLWDRVAAFMETHSVQFKLPNFLKEQFVEETEDDEGRGKKVKRYLPALLMGLMMKGSMLAMALKGLALLAGKALMVSKLALLLAGIVALKKLFSGGGEKTTYEIVKQPIVSHSHQYSTSHEFGGEYGGHGGGGFEGGHGGYGRSLDLPYPHKLAYRAQIPAATQPSQ